MTDMTAFERQLTGEITGLMGPVRPVDDAAIFTAITATQSPKWRFGSMFSATKFVVAGAIVALFGGFLLSGVLTQQPSDEPLPPAAASASATIQAEPTDATTEPEPTAEAVADATTPDLLPGVDLVTEEVEPGVYRVLSDGVRDIGWTGSRDSYSSVHAGLDGSVVVSRVAGSPCRLEKNCHGHVLGSPETFSLVHDRLTFRTSHVGPDGTIWGNSFVQGDGTQDLRSWDGERWQVRRKRGSPFPSGVAPVEIAADGTVFARWVTATEEGKVKARKLGQLTTDGWDVIQDGDAGWLTANADGTLILFQSGDMIYRITDSGLEEFREFDEIGMLGVAYKPDGWPRGTANDGVLWWQLRGYATGEPVDWLFRLDSSGWTTFEYPSDFPVESDGLVPGPDGAVWVSASGPTADGSIGRTGLYRFDGRDWRLFLPGTSPLSFDIAPDGSIWALAREGDDISLYVITPEAVAE